MFSHTFCYFGEEKNLNIPNDYYNGKILSYSKISQSKYIIEQFANGNKVGQVDFDVAADQQCFGELYLNCWHYGYDNNVIPPVPYYSLNGFLYQTDFFEEEKIIRSFVPVPQGLKIGNFTVPSNGMYDMAEQKFYPNAGTGEFIYGKD